MANEEAHKKEVARMNKKIKEEFYSLLLDSSKSVDDAKMFCTSLSSAGIQAFFNQLMATMKVSDLKIEDKLNKEDPNFARFLLGVQMFKDETITNALNMINHSREAIEAFERKKSKETLLKDLPTDFI